MAVGAADGSTSIVSLGKIGVKVTLDRNVFVNHNNIVETSHFFDLIKIYFSLNFGRRLFENKIIFCKIEINKTHLISIYLKFLGYMPEN